MLARSPALSLQDLPHRKVDIESVGERLTDPFVLKCRHALAAGVPAHERVTGSGRPDDVQRCVAVELTHRGEIEVTQGPEDDVDRAVLERGVDRRAIHVPVCDLFQQGCAPPVTQISAQPDLFTMTPSAEDERPAADRGR